MYKPKIIVWLEAWLNHNSVSENLSDENFFHNTVTFIVQVKLYFEVSNLEKRFSSSQVRGKIIKWLLCQVVDIFLIVLEEPAWQQKKMVCYETMLT